MAQYYRRLSTLTVNVKLNANIMAILLMIATTVPPLLNLPLEALIVLSIVVSIVVIIVVVKGVGGVIIFCPGGYVLSSWLCLRLLRRLRGDSGDQWRCCPAGPSLKDLRMMRGISNRTTPPSSGTANESSI